MGNACKLWQLLTIYPFMILMKGVKKSHAVMYSIEIFIQLNSVTKSIKTHLIMQMLEIILNGIMHMAFHQHVSYTYLTVEIVISAQFDAQELNFNCIELKLNWMYGAVFTPYQYGEFQKTKRKPLLYDGIQFNESNILCSWEWHNQINQNEFGFWQIKLVFFT